MYKYYVVLCTNANKEAYFSEKRFPVLLAKSLTNKGHLFLIVSSDLIKYYK